MNARPGKQGVRNEKFLRDFDWNLLLTFLVIAEERSITAASRRLLRTQPSVSNALSRLEKSLGHKLIERRRGVFQLTSHGRLLHERALQACSSVEAIGNLIKGDAKLSGEISYQIASHMECPGLNTALHTFHKEQPNVTFFIETVPSEKIIANLLEETTKIGFCVLKTKVAGLECRYLNQNEMGFFCGARHPLFGREGLTLDDLNQHGYISFESDLLSAGLDAVARLGVGSQFRDFRIAVSPNDEEVLRLIDSGIGFGPLFLQMALPLVQTGRLWQLPPYSNSPRISNFLVTNPKNNLAAAEARFVELVESECPL